MYNYYGNYGCGRNINETCGGRYVEPIVEPCQPIYTQPVYTQPIYTQQTACMPSACARTYGNTSILGDCGTSIGNAAYDFVGDWVNIVVTLTILQSILGLVCNWNCNSAC